jgi:hypothetical protein
MDEATPLGEAVGMWKSLSRWRNKLRENHPTAVEVD